LVQKPFIAVDTTMSATMNNTQTSPSSPVRDLSAATGRYHRADRPALPRAWWAGQRHYTVYMLRELSSVFVALWALRLLVRLNRLRQGRAAYERFMAAERRPGWVMFNLTTFLFALLHSVTFLQAAGMGPRVRVKGRKVDAATITSAAFVGWGIASLGILLALFLGGRSDDAG